MKIRKASQISQNQNSKCHFTNLNPKTYKRPWHFLSNPFCFEGLWSCISIMNVSKDSGLKDVSSSINKKITETGAV